MASPGTYEHDLAIWARALKTRRRAVPPGDLLNKSLFSRRWAARYHAVRATTPSLPTWAEYQALAKSGEDLSERYALYQSCAPALARGKSPEAEYPQCVVCKCRKRTSNVWKCAKGHRVCYRCTRKMESTTCPCCDSKSDELRKAQIYGTIYFVSPDGVFFPPVYQRTPFHLFRSLQRCFNPHPYEVLQIVRSRPEISEFLAHLKRTGNTPAVGCSFWSRGKVLTPEQTTQKIMDCESPWIQEVTYSFRIACA